MTAFKRVYIDVESDIAEKFKQICIKKNYPMKRTLEDLVRDYVDKNKKLLK